MKKEAKELVSKIFNTLKWDIPHPDLQEIFEGSLSVARLVCNSLADAIPHHKEKYDKLMEEIDKVTFKQVYE